MPLHLLFPLFSSVTFVFGVMLAKRGIMCGTSPWTTTFLGNVWLALAFGTVGIVVGEPLPAAEWGKAAAIGGCFVLGQLFTYLAFQIGDVSVAAPIFGVKVLIVAILIALLTGVWLSWQVWLGAVLAALGVGLVQATGLHQGRIGLKRTSITVALVFSAGVALSLFDIGLQQWGEEYPAPVLLPAVFISAAGLSCLMLPWVDRPAAIVANGSARWIVAGTLLMALQAMSMSWSLTQYSDAARINIVYALRSLWGVVLAWGLAGAVGGSEAGLGRGVMLLRLAGAALLTAAVALAVTGGQHTHPATEAKALSFIPGLQAPDAAGSPAALTPCPVSRDLQTGELISCSLPGLTAE